MFAQVSVGRSFLSDRRFLQRRKPRLTMPFYFLRTEVITELHSGEVSHCCRQLSSSHTCPISRDGPCHTVSELYFGALVSLLHSPTAFQMRQYHVNEGPHNYVCYRFTVMYTKNRSQWPRGLRCRSAAACLLGLRVRIPLKSWMFVSCIYMLYCPV
jgi:hypothetical protein